MVKSLRNDTGLFQLIADVSQNLWRYIAIFNQVQSLHGITSLEGSFHRIVNGFVNDLQQNIIVRIEFFFFVILSELIVIAQTCFLSFSCNSHANVQEAPPG